MKERLLKIALFAIVLLVAVGCSGNGEQEALSDEYDFPDYVLEAHHPGAIDAYQYAVDHGDDLDHIPCYCNCFVEPFNHESVKDCFIDNEQATDEMIVYDSHGAG
ncbi:PCYCGC domain-containing protein [Desertibacillus haloalkaliphilus]|nr:PCYCGC domain-containing protein [Desertibacillus haloalkaliphilus]